MITDKDDTYMYFDSFGFYYLNEIVYISENFIIIVLNINTH